MKDQVKLDENWDFFFFSGNEVLRCYSSYGRTGKMIEANLKNLKEKAAPFDCI